MAEQITYTFPLAFYYESKLPVPIDEIVKSLLALEKLVAKVPLLLGELSGTKIDLHSLKVEKIESGSLKELLEMSISFLSEGIRPSLKLGSRIPIWEKPQRSQH